MEAARPAGVVGEGPVAAAEGAEGDEDAVVVDQGMSYFSIFLPFSIT